jgi:2-keto-4-pentenoate hydratase/2-oxohepta-3-ene-1,7-dioic acid hydratase in catechol pathway
MKLASFLTDEGPCWGLATDDGVAPAPARLRARFPTLRAALAANALCEIGDGEAAIALGEISFLPPIPNPQKIICIGKNYVSHAAESGDKPAPYPSLFVRLANTLVAHGGALVRPLVSDHFDYEGELAMIVGRGGRHIAQAQALSHIAGYACFNDASVRDYQFGHSLTAGKNFFATAGFGPWLRTADAIADPSALSIITRLNGNEVQRGNTADLIFGLAEIVSYVSAITPLAPGDVIATGTPEGVGFARTPPLWLKPGDTIEVEIPGVGLLRNTVTAEA